MSTQDNTVYDEAIERVAKKTGLTVQQVDDVMNLYYQESKEVHIERGNLRPDSKVASSNRTRV